MNRGSELRDHIHAAVILILHPFVTLAGTIIAYQVFRLALRFTPFNYSSKVGAAAFAALLAGALLWNNPGRWRRAFEVSLYPVLFPAVGVTLLALTPTPPGLGAYKGGLLSMAAVALCLAGIGFQHYRARYRPRQRTEPPVIQGARLLSYEEAKQRAALLPNPTTTTVRWGGLDLPEKFATEHFAVVGSPGSGKSIHINYTLKSVLEHMRTGADCRAVLYDSKRNLYAQIKAMAPDVEVRILNPFDARTYAWDIAADFQSDDDIVEAAETFFPTPGRHTDPFFYEAPRGMLAGIITSFHEARPGQWTFADILSAFAGPDLLREVLELARSKNLDRINNYLPTNDPNRDVLGVIANQVQKYRTASAFWRHTLATQPDRRLSLDDWLKGNYVLLVQGNPRNPFSIAAINRIVFRRLFQLVLAQPPSERARFWFFLDEFGTMGRLEGIQHFLLESRVRGAAVVLGFQDVASLEESYEKTGLSQIMQGAANIAALTIRGPETAKWAEGYFGMQEVLQQQTTQGTSTGGRDGQHTSQSTSEQPRAKPLLYGADFQALANDRDGVFPGYFNTASVGIYKHRLLAADATCDVPHTGDDSPDNFHPRDAAEGVFQFWTPEEHARFGLPTEKPKPATPPPALPPHYEPGRLRGKKPGA